MSKQIVVTINRAGKVGKSTLAKHLFAPALAADWLQVETFNDAGTGADGKTIGKRFHQVAERVLGGDRSVIVDVGASNYAESIAQLQGLSTFVGLVNLWVVPTVMSEGVIRDSFATAEDLITDLDVDPARIVIVPNRVDDPTEQADRVEALQKAAKKLGVTFLGRSVLESQHYDAYNRDERDVFEIAADRTDFMAEIAVAKNAGEQKKADQLLRGLTLKDMAIKSRRNLRAILKDLPLELEAEAV